MQRSLNVDGILFVALIDPPAISLRCPQCFAPLKGAVVGGVNCLVGPTPSCCATPLRAFADQREQAEWEKQGWEEFQKAA
jgi:hypothetical protein